MENEEEQNLPENLEEALQEDEELNEASSSLPQNPIDEEIKEPEAHTNQFDLKKLLKSPIFWTFLGVILFFGMIALLIFQLDFDLNGIGNTNPTYRPQPCSKILLTWEREEYTKAHIKDIDYEEITDPSLVDLEYEDTNHIKRWDYTSYDYDTYITNVIWTDNQSANVVDNSTVYQAMSVAARSFLVSYMPENCVILKDYNPQNFTELDGSEENYQEINDAVIATKGLIIGRNKEIIAAVYDPFSYVFKREDGTSREHFYHMMQKNHEEQQRILATWVDDHPNIPITKVDEVKEFESMSLYGAKYLLEAVHSGKQYNLHRILEYYYGRDIEYYTIDYASSNEYNPGTDCSPISMKNTSLSREEFVSAVERYAKTKNSSGLQTLTANAGMIYDMSVSQGINPELIFIRADLEGYSPGTDYNYWGLGCTNTGGVKACLKYGSLSEGVAGFLKNISKYATILEMMKKYAYIGAYWYNPGSSSLGGCYYAPYIYETIPERVQVACSNAHPCTTAHESTCIATTDEDQNAYAQWQVEKIISKRKSIFGLDADACDADKPGEGNGSCILWAQGDSRWKNIPLGSSKTNMGRSGCAVTSIAMAMSCSGTPINDLASFNPGTLVNALNRYNGFDNSGGIYWDNQAIRTFAPSFQFYTSLQIDKNSSDEYKISTLKSYMTGNRMLIVHFKNLAHPRGHYTVLKSISGNKLTVYDPAGGKVNTYNIKDLDKIVVYKY